MAEHESDREDLLAEARNLVLRAELSVAGFEETVVIGFRALGAGSIFFGQDPVYHFTSDNRLRRAYSERLLYKCEDARIVSLDRQRRDGKVLLLRHELNEQESTQFRDELARRIARLRQDIAQDHFDVLGKVPADEDVLQRIAAWLRELPDFPELADAPNVA